MFSFKRRELPEFLNVPWGVREVAVLIVVWFGSQVAIGAGLGAIAPHAAAVHQFLAAARSGNVAASFALDLVGVVIGLTIVGLYLRRYKVGWQMVGWRKVGVLRGLKYLGGVLVAFVVLSNLALLAARLIPGFQANQPQTNAFIMGAGTNHGLALLALVVVPPIFEETVFRGFLFPALAKHGGVIWGAVLSSVIFGLAHGQANLFVYTAILGMLLCFMYRRLGSIVPGIFLHMLNNYLAFIALSGK